MKSKTIVSNKPSLALIKDEVRRLDPAVDPESDHFKSAVLLLSLATVGVGRVSAFTGYGGGFINPRLARLRQNGILLRGGGIAANWFNRGGGLDFWMDVCVAEGLMERAQSCD